MNNEKQQKILEMAKDICRVKLNCNDVCNPVSACDALKYAERAVEAGYVKQSEGEWEELGQDYANCSACGTIYSALPTMFAFKQNNKFCRHCGAKMKGGVTAESAIKAVQEAAHKLKDTPPDDLLGIGSTMQF